MSAQIRFDLGGRAYGESDELQVAAVGTWVSACLKHGGRVEPRWSDALHRRVGKRAADLALDEHGLDADGHRIGIRTDERWRLAGADWHDYFLSVLAVPGDPGEQGAAARRAMRRARTPATRVRIVTYRGESVDGDTRREVHRTHGSAVGASSIRWPCSGRSPSASVPGAPVPWPPCGGSTRG